MTGRSAGWMRLLLSINNGLYYVTCSPSSATTDLSGTGIVYEKAAGVDEISNIQIIAVDNTYFRLKVTATRNSINGSVILLRNFSILSVS